MSKAPQTTGLGTLLRHLVEQLDGDVERVYRELGVDCRSRFTPIFRHLEQYGPSSMRKIACTSGLSHSAISQTVSEMLKKGLVLSVPGKDGRERIISLSPSGQALLPELHRIWAAIWAAADEISSEIGASLPLVLGKAVSALEETPFKTRIERQLELSVV